MTTEITTEQRDKIAEETKGLVARAQDLTILTEIENTNAVALTAVYKKEIKRRTEILRPTEEALKASKKAFNDLWDMMITPLESGVKIITTKSGVFLLAEERRRADQQRIEDARVAALQAKEDARVAALQAKEDARVAEAQRVADERHAARLEAEQAKADAEGRAAAVIAPAPVITAKAIAAPVVVQGRVIAAVSAPEGTTFTTYWSGKCTDIIALCKAVAEGKVDPEYVQINQVALNAWAKLKKTEGPILSGCIGVKTKGNTQR